MLRHRHAKWAGILLFLVLANIALYIYLNWGLITVKVTDAPLNKVIKSIEWQGWVKIYTNLPLDTKVTMYVDHVPLAEAMESLAAGVTVPPQDRPDRGERGNRPDGGSPPGGPGGGNGPGGPGGGGLPGGPGGFAGGGPPGGGAPPDGGGGRGGFGRGGGGFGGAQWNLAFFVAPTSAEVKAEILAFQNGTTDDNTLVYTYNTPLQMVATDDFMAAADPRQQSWPGWKAPAPTPTPDPSTAGTPGAPVDAVATNSDGQAATDADAAPTLQTYLQGFAQSANIWIMAPGSWKPAASAPPPNSSIISAVKNFISSSHGAVVQAIVLRMGRGGRGPGGRGGGFADIDSMADRMRNAISGLPDDSQAGALNQLNAEVSFYRSVQAAPQEQRRDLIRQHMMEKMANGNNNWRRTPEQRAARYQRMVSNRMTAQGKK